MQAAILPEIEPVILGIDPGLNGGLAIISNKKKLIATMAMPLNTEKHLDVKSVMKFLAGHNIENAFIESNSAFPGQGVVSMYNFGRITGQIEGVIETLSINLNSVRPKKWQEISHFAINNRLPPKERSLMAAKKLFPGYDFGDKSVKSNLVAYSRPHDGIMDAALIAYYGLHVLRKVNNINIAMNKSREDNDASI